ncbi:hypothetical protein [Nocardioides daeguensis]|uniref:Glycosyltransferase RgtA/B/C/D-like domain-containing protein n=1 Tax=Nocardioides daeguensis TaxID=908359 RepID=A0ABP6W5D4_9ACTN|nr:hypothetical protein [Nocardioides daeguensis]MBV6729831.1 hypothetical protein [Nocardioides daeguensis]MCR1774341.1 hypothetical protein [Nocardioides daeguensis]
MSVLSTPCPAVVPASHGAAGWAPAWLAAALVCLARAPYLTAPATPDEGGFLLVASQWRPGTSLYGDYWVDRPPLLLVVHGVAAGLGGVVALRAIGLVAVTASVFLAVSIARQAGVRSTAPVVIAAAFLTTPLFGALEIDGELLAVPLVLAGVLALVRACTADTQETTAADVARWAAAAGAAAAGAAMIKQNAVDVFVVAVVLLATARTRSRVRAGRLGVLFLSGAAATTLAVLGYAALRGTGPSGLWDAVVSFRLQAASVIRSSASDATPRRLVTLTQAAVLSAAPLVIGVMTLRAAGACEAAGADVGGVGGIGRVPDLRWPALALLGWEVASIAGGGSFWLHYLVVLVPGMVLAAVAAGQRPARLRRTTIVALTVAVVSGAVSLMTVSYLPSANGSDAKVARYLTAHATRGDTAVVAFGHPDILWDAGLSSPYPELWSLPVRVRDPRLAEFGAVLASPRAPTWVVVNGTGLATWGVDATSAQQTLDARYHPVAAEGSYVIWRR